MLKGVLKLLDKYIVVKYLRLSLEDGDDAESDSISNQRNLLDYNISNMFNSRDIEIVELVDDGYSGTNMNRPGMKKLLILAETGGINCVIVKDMSRFARDYIEVGMYMEQKFPLWNIRFIALNDNYDSADYRGITGGMDIAFKNITYTMYSRDLSEKIKSARNVLGKKGKFISPYAFYGYKKSAEDKRKLVIDPIAAAVVKRIYLMKKSGIKNSQIAAILNKEKIPTPSMYKKMLDPDCRDWNNNYPYWSANNIRVILIDERYTGKMISCKLESAIVGSHKIRRKDKDKWLVVENTHEAIISQELFDSVQGKPRKKRNNPKPKGILTGLIKCGGCNHNASYYALKNGTIKYRCTYRQYDEHNSCFEGVVYEDEIIDFVKKLIRLEIEKTVDMQRSIQCINNLSKKNEQKIKAQDKSIEFEKRKKVDNYLLLTKGELTEEEFTSRQEAINKKISECEEIKKSLQADSISQAESAEYNLFSKYIDAEDISGDIIHDLVKAIHIHQNNRVEVIWNFAERNS